MSSSEDGIAFQLKNSRSGHVGRLKCLSPIYFYFLETKYNLFGLIISKNKLNSLRFCIFSRRLKLEISILTEQKRGLVPVT